MTTLLVVEIHSTILAKSLTIFSMQRDAFSIQKYLFPQVFFQIDFAFFIKISLNS